MSLSWFDPTESKTLFVSHMRAALPSFLLALLIGFGPQLAQAQSSNDISERLRLIDQVLNDLQRAVYKGEKPPTRPAPSANLGANGISAETRRLADLEVRLSDLESQIRSLTGPIETVDHRVNQVATRLDKLVSDIDFRLRAIESGLQPQGTTASQPATASAQLGASTEPVKVTTKVVGQAASGTQVLGSVPARDLTANGATQKAALTPAVPEKPKGVLPEGTVAERYKFAYGLLRRLKMDEAEVALKEFLKAHPSVPLADNARYWLGESYFNRRKYTQAASAFFAAYSKSPKGVKASDNLYKLGKSLARMDQKDDACASFDELLEKFNAPVDQRIRQRAQVDRTELGCQ